MVAGDLYMDGFEESIFAGKGLIDVEAFALVTEEVFPPEQVLSHDTLEGSLLRTGLVSDVEMTDGVPSGMAAGSIGFIAGSGGTGRTSPFYGIPPCALPAWISGSCWTTCAAP